MKQFDRKFLVNHLTQVEEWDIVIIGGGATGLGIAVDAATRGYKTLLVEQEDFAKGTSSRSTKLVHGGVRYLAQGNISLVKEALRERGLLLQNAPHLTRNEVFIIPCYSWFMGIFYAIGLKFYDWLAGKLSLGHSKFISRKEVIKRLPEINPKGLRCGVLYHDGTFDDARLALNLAQTCNEEGGIAINYCQVINLSKDNNNKINGLKLIDKETGKLYELRSKVVVNATGVFADDILRLDKPETDSIIRPSQGVHLVLDKGFLKSSDAIMIPHTDDGRVLFVIPWYNRVLVGTTDTPLKSHSLEPRALEKEVEFILKNAGRYLARQPAKSDVLSVFAGLRPLAATNDQSEKTKEISRSHKIIFSDSGLVSVIGGKWTTYRRMAQDTLNKVIARKALPPVPCTTSNLRIHGYAIWESPSPLMVYGSDEINIKNLIKSDPSLGTPLSSSDSLIAAQVVWAVRNEMARTVEDVLARRVRILFVNARAAIQIAPEVADIMMKELGKDKVWRDDQVNKFSLLAKGYLLE